MDAVLASPASSQSSILESMKQFAKRLREVGVPRLYRRQSNLLFQGEVPRDAIVVLDGIVKVYSISPDGDEIIVDMFGRGAVLPASWINGQSQTSLLNYQAANDVRTIEVTKDKFHEILNESTEFQNEYIDELTKIQVSLLLRVTGLCQPRSVEKICYTLYHLLFRYGLERDNGNYEIDLKLTQHTIASLIGQTRESTAKNLKLLKAVGIIDYTSSTYTVNKPKLEAYLGEDSFQTLDLR